MLHQILLNVNIKVQARHRVLLLFAYVLYWYKILVKYCSFLLIKLVLFMNTVNQFILFVTTHFVNDMAISFCILLTSYDVIIDLIYLFPVLYDYKGII